MDPSGFVYVKVTGTSEISGWIEPETLIKLPRATPDVITGEPPRGTANTETEIVIELKTGLGATVAS